MRSTILSTLALAAIFVSTLSAPASAQPQIMPVKVCMGVSTCGEGASNTFGGLQAAFDYISALSRQGTEGWVYLKPGWHASSPTRFRAFQHSDHNDPECDERAAWAGFLLTGRTAPTHVEGISFAFGEPMPQDTKIWGKMPYALIQNHGSQALTLPRFHGLAVVDVEAPVTFFNVSLVADGGYSWNGAGDAALYVHDSRVNVFYSAVLANKGPANCLREATAPFFQVEFEGEDRDVYHDQEGILVDGSLARLTVEDSAVGGNIHTGIMVIDAGRADVERSIVRGNGWDSSHFADEQKGHGVTSYADACLDNDTEIDVRNSLVINNSGHGVFLRGEFEASNQVIDFNDLDGNGNPWAAAGDVRYGMAMTGNPVDLRTTIGAQTGAGTVQVEHNNYGTDDLTILFQHVDFIQSAEGRISDVNADLIDVTGTVIVSPSTNPGSAFQGGTPWLWLLAVHNELMAMTADDSCPSF